MNTQYVPQSLIAPACPAGAAPGRHSLSLRRTSTIETDWPDGFGGPMHLIGRARDMFTPPDTAEALTLDSDWFDILAKPQREIMSVRTSRFEARAQALVGLRGGGGMRKELVQLYPEAEIRSTPLYLLLDDYPGATLVAGWAWSRWIRDSLAERRAIGAVTSGRTGVGDMAGVCSGFRPGSRALDADGGVNISYQSSTVVPSLLNPVDPAGWHEMTEQAGVAMRRARRLDLWRDDDGWQVDIGFQDSATTPTGEREAVHEYRVRASVAPDSFELTALTAVPQVLPYAECVGAVHNVDRMIGRPVADFRFAVTATLPGVLGCTHLNDVLRSMADIPALAARLGQAAHTTRI